MTVPTCQPEYSAFTHYLATNEPCLFDSSLCASWTACQKWRQGPNQPDWDYLEHQYGSAPVSLWECRSDSQEEMTLTEALQKIRSTSQNRHKSSSFTDNDAPLYYIKDWHLALHCDHHNLPPFYTTPDVFRDDWINGYYLNQRDEDFRFVYAGIQGSYTGRPPPATRQLRLS